MLLSLMHSAAAAALTSSSAAVTREYSSPCIWQYLPAAAKCTKELQKSSLFGHLSTASQHIVKHVNSVYMAGRQLKYGSLCGVALGREQILLLHHCLEVFGLACRDRRLDIQCMFTVTEIIATLVLSTGNMAGCSMMGH